MFTIVRQDQTNSGVLVSNTFEKFEGKGDALRWIEDNMAAFCATVADEVEWTAASFIAYNLAPNTIITAWTIVPSASLSVN